MMSEMILTDLRERLHKCPELSLKEYKTAEIILEFISDYVSGSEFFSVHRPFLTSIVLEYRNADKDIPFKLFRADMDVLPITESENNQIVSENKGVMHACGHDIHMTVLCGLIAETAVKKPKKNVLFVFQPGEEGAGGAKKLLETGFFDRYKIESAVALHVTDDYKVGEVASNGDVLFAIPREVDIVFKGKSAHAAFPEKGNDALISASFFLSSYEGALRKTVNPTGVFLAHFGKIRSGTARNIISDHTEIEGTLRSFEMDVMLKGTEIIEKTAVDCAKRFGCTAEMKILGEYVAVKNDPALFNMLRSMCTEAGFKCIEKKGELVGEDFGYFTQKWTGLLFWLGSRASAATPNSLHSNDFFPDSKAIDVGVEIMMSFLLD